LQQHHIANAVRITALETVLVHVAKVAFLTSGVSAEALDHLRRDAQQKLQLRFPGLDPALSDHISAEFSTELDRLIVQIQSAVSNAWSQIAAQSGQG